jgi:hypothetical protein
VPGCRAGPDSSDKGPGRPGSGQAQSGHECDDLQQLGAAILGVAAGDEVEIPRRIVAGERHLTAAAQRWHRRSGTRCRGCRGRAGTGSVMIVMASAPQLLKIRTAQAVLTPWSCKNSMISRKPPAPPRRERAVGAPGADANECSRRGQRRRRRSALSQPWRPRALLRLARLAVDLVADDARRHLGELPDQGLVERLELRPQDVTQEALRRLEHDRGPAALAWVAIRAQTVTPSKREEQLP